MIIKVSPITYIQTASSRDLLSYLKLPVVSNGDLKTVEGMINSIYLENNKIEFDKMISPHGVSIYMSTEETENEPNIYIEYYNDAKSLTKIILLDILMQAKYIKGDMLKGYLNSKYIFREMKKDFDEETINQAIEAFDTAVNNLGEYDCVDTLQAINILNRADFRIAVDLITCQLQSIYQLEYAVLMPASELEEYMKDNLFVKYFTKQIRVEVPNQEKSHCFGSININKELLSCFNSKAIDEDSILIKKTINLYSDLAKDIKSLDEYLPVTSYKDLSSIINITASTHGKSDLELNVYSKIIFGEIIKAFIQENEFYSDDDIYNIAIRTLIKKF